MSQTNLPAACDQEQPNPADQAILLLLANRRFMKVLLPFIKTIRAFYPNPAFKKLIDAMERTNRESLAAMDNFERQLIQLDKPTEARRHSIQQVSQLYEDCALLPYRIEPGQFDDLAMLIAGLRANNYTAAPDELINAIRQAPDKPNAQIGIVLHQHLPDLPREKRDALALSLGVNYSVLFDLSHGVGKLPDQWPSLIAATRCGYAGGLSPQKLKEQIGRIEEKAKDVPIWIDMETHVQSDNDRVFDLEKVERCLEIAAPYVGVVAA